MKLVICIPAFNEEKTIGKVIREIPKRIEGIDEIKVLVIDDGSTDDTVRVAKKFGADYILRHKENLGLAITFSHGLEEALKRGADIIVNTDADFQYNQGEIPKLVNPILEKKADIVLTDRRVLNLNHMPFGKKYGNVLATWVTRMVSGYAVKDAQSGFRAFSREAALRLNILGDYTYVQETIIQAVFKKLKIVQIPCEFRKRAGDGKSRLISNLWTYAKRAGSIIVRTYIRYKPLKFFITLGIITMIPGVILSSRFLIPYFVKGGGQHLQSLILGTMLLIMGLQIIVMALVADTVNANRKINEEILYKLKKKEYERSNPRIN